MPLQRFEFQAIFQADDILSGDRALDRHRRLGRLYRGRGLALRYALERRIDLTDEIWDLGARYRIVADISGDDACGERNIVAATRSLGHDGNSTTIALKC